MSKFKELVESGLNIIEMVNVNFIDHLDDSRFENVQITGVQFVDGDLQTIDDQLVLFEEYIVKFRCDFIVTFDGDRSMCLKNHDCFERVNLELTETDYINIKENEYKQVN